jgi:hypothetical protein
MAEKAPEVHVKALLDAGAQLGVAAEVVVKRAADLSTPPPSAPAPASTPAPVIPKK